MSTQPENTEELQQEVAEIVKNSHCSKRCSDYDEDCIKVQDHVACFLGFNLSHPEIIFTKCDGYCPFIHNPN